MYFFEFVWGIQKMHKPWYNKSILVGGFLMLNKRSVHVFASRKLWKYSEKNHKTTNLELGTETTGCLGDDFVGKSQASPTFKSTVFCTQLVAGRRVDGDTEQDRFGAMGVIPGHWSLEGWHQNHPQNPLEFWRMDFVLVWDTEDQEAKANDVLVYQRFIHIYSCKQKSCLLFYWKIFLPTFGILASRCKLKFVFFFQPLDPVFVWKTWGGNLGRKVSTFKTSIHLDMYLYVYLNFTPRWSSGKYRYL